MERLSFDEQLEDLRDISGTVDDYIVRGLYIADTGIDNAYNPNQILAECYDIIIDELTEFGITFVEDVEDLLQDWYTAKHIYYIRAFVDGDNLLRLLSVRQELEQLESILDTDTYDNLFQLVVDFVFPRTTSEIYQILSDFGDRVHVDETFVKHMKACIERIRQTGSEYHIPDNELPLVRSYIEQVRKSRIFVKKAYEYLITQFSPIQYSKYLPITDVNKFLRTYDLDKLSPKNLRKFATLDHDGCLDPVELKEIEDYHHAHSIHHFEYYQSHGYELTPTVVIFIYIALLGEQPSVNEFLKKAKTTTDRITVYTNDSSTWLDELIPNLVAKLSDFLTQENESSTTEE